MDSAYNHWLINKIPCRDLVDYEILAFLSNLRIKQKLLRKVDNCTRALAFSLRDDYIVESKDKDAQETRYNGNVTVLEFMLALCWPYEFQRYEGEEAQVLEKDEFGNSAPSYETRMNRRIRIFFVLLDQFKPYYDNKHVFNEIIEDFYSGELRAFLKLQIPNIEKMPVRDQLACFLHKKKIRKVTKKEMSDMINLVGSIEGTGAYI